MTARVTPEHTTPAGQVLLATDEMLSAFGHLGHLLRRAANLVERRGTNADVADRLAAVPMGDRSDAQFLAGRQRQIHERLVAEVRRKAREVDELGPEVRALAGAVLADADVAIFQRWPSLSEQFDAICTSIGLLLRPAS